MNERVEDGTENKQLLEFREKMREVKAREMTKKGEGANYDPQFNLIDPNSLGEEERVTYEKLTDISYDEFESLRLERFKNMQPSAKEIEAYKRELTQEQSEKLSKIFSGHGNAPRTPEEKSIAAFWDFLANVLTGLPNKRKS